MKIFYLKRFEREYKKLSLEIKRLAEKKEDIFRNNPFDTRLKTHKLHGELSGFWSFCINYEYRIIFELVSREEVRFYRVGKHDIY